MYFLYVYFSEILLFYFLKFFIFLCRRWHLLFSYGMKSFAYNVSQKN